LNLHYERFVHLWLHQTEARVEKNSGVTNIALIPGDATLGESPLNIYRASRKPATVRATMQLYKPRWVCYTHI